MFHRIVDGIFNPSQVINYRDDRKITTIGVLLFFSILLMIPSIISAIVVKPFGYETKVIIKDSFFNNIEIPYVIENNKLTFVGKTEKTQYYVNVEELNLTVCFTTQEEIILEEKMLKNVLVFNTDSVYVYNMLENFKILNYYEYPGFFEMDFRLAKDNNRIFWQNFFDIVYDVLENYKDIILVSLIISIVGQSIISILILTTFLTIFNRLGSKNIYKFGVHWRLMLYYSGPFVLGTLLATLFNFVILQYAGLIVTLIYSFRINQINFIKGE